jgi:hypothetical protein
MATPTNPLDIFVTYVPHFELHAASSWEALKAVQSVDVNAVTTDRERNGTLLINTRKDAHQQIDNVRFRYMGPSVDPSGAMHPIDDVTMDVTEPNGTFFIEKIKNLQNDFQVTDLMAGLIFGLKIFFVGRLKDGSEHTIPFTKMIPLQLTDLDAKFSHRGGEYSLKFYTSGTAIASTPLRPTNSLSKAISYTNKNVSFKCNTVQEAIELLEQKLNKNYEDVYSTELKNATGARQIKYKINLDPKINGQLNLVTKDSFARNEKCHLTFEPSVDIGSMIRSIITSSKEVNEMIAGSAGYLRKEFQRGVKIPVLQTLYHLEGNVLNVVYNVKLYEGGGDTYVFDYYFSGPGKNVDVMEFEVRFPKMILWMSSTVSGTELNRNSVSQIPTERPDYYAGNNVHEDTTRHELYNVPREWKVIDALKGDVAFLPATNRAEGTGFVKLEAKAVPSARLAFETISKASAALDTQLTFTIRGHHDLLERVVTQPDGGSVGFGVTDGLWCKVNIYNSDGSQFFYTGHYRILTIDNIFSGGKFTQLLTVMMTDKV